MRQIKFRGQTIGGEWVTGNLSILEKDFSSTVKKGYYISNSAGAPFAFMVRPESVGQFTGLHDKNGTEIYEGDVLQYNHGSNESYVVEYVIKGFNQSFGHGLVGVRTICGFDFNPYHNVPERCQVIGNIHTDTNSK